MNAMGITSAVDATLGLAARDSFRGNPRLPRGGIVRRTDRALLPDDAAVPNCGDGERTPSTRCDPGNRLGADWAGQSLHRWSADDADGPAALAFCRARTASARQSGLPKNWKRWFSKHTPPAGRSPPMPSATARLICAWMPAARRWQNQPRASMPATALNTPCCSGPTKWGALARLGILPVYQPEFLDAISVMLTPKPSATPAPTASCPTPRRRQPACLSSFRPTSPSFPALRWTAFNPPQNRRTPSGDRAWPSSDRLRAGLPAGVHRRRGVQRLSGTTTGAKSSPGHRADFARAWPTGRTRLRFRRQLPAAKLFMETSEMTDLKTVQTPLLDAAYLEQGPADGKPIILLHGWPYDAHTWDAVDCDRWRRQGWRTPTPHTLRGFGPTKFRDPLTRRSGQMTAIAQGRQRFCRCAWP